MQSLRGLPPSIVVLLATALFALLLSVLDHYHVHAFTTLFQQSDPRGVQIQQIQQQLQQQQQPRHQRPTAISPITTTTTTTATTTTTLSVSISSPSEHHSSSSSSSSPSSSSYYNNNHTTTTATTTTTMDEVLEIPSQDEHKHQELMMRKGQLQTPVTTFETVEECLSAMDESTDDLTVVLFFAHYCKKCHHANIPYKRLAYSNPSIEFTRLETSLMSSKRLKSLGVSRVPFLQIYRNGICVASFSTPWKLEIQLKETLDLCQQRSTTDWMTFCQQHEEEIQGNKHARQTIWSQIVQSNQQIIDSIRQRQVGP